jgi:hypothetical protein
MNLTCCEKPIVIVFQAKCSDMCAVDIVEPSTEKTLAMHEGYVPNDLGVGGGDYVGFDYCGNCGKIIGEFPLDMDAVIAELSE